MGFSEVSSSGLTAMQIHFEQTRCNFQKVFKGAAGRAVAPHQLLRVTGGQSSRKSLFPFGEILAVRKLCSESFLLISFFMLLFFIIMLLQSHPSPVPCPHHLGICESLSLHTADANAPDSSAALFTTSSGVTNKIEIPPFPVSQPLLHPRLEETHTSGHYKT